MDFTPGDGECAMAYLRNKRGYVGICFNDFHLNALHDHLIDCVIKAFSKPGDPLFHPAFASGATKLAKLPDQKPTDSEKGPDKTKKRKKAQKDGKKSKKSKNKKAKKQAQAEDLPPLSEFMQTQMARHFRFQWH